jgi:ribosomal protein S12 methylthiotransferase
MISQNYKVGFVSLGCPKALVDSERIITQLRAEGYELVNSYQQAALVIINTCGFIQSARDESLASIAQALDENGKVIVTGCLGAKPETITERFPQVLSITGPQSYESVMEAVHTHLPPPQNPFISLVPPQGIKLTPRHYAYLKISEGCNHKCTFCIIPSMRGKLVSRPIDEVLREAEKLAAAGVKELLIISQDTSAYGVDVKYSERLWRDQTWQTRFYDLVKALGELGIWIRLHYVYPYPHVDDIIPLMAEGKILPYLDIPFQHASPKILKLMKRPASSESVLSRVKAWRKICPDITIRSTFITGFPGETAEDFQMLLDFLEDAEIDRAGCFIYSPVEGAKANELKDPVPAEIQQERYERFMQKQAQISEKRMQAKVGKTLAVLIDAVEADQAIGRTAADAPEIDGLVYIRNPKGLQPGQIVSVFIEESDTYDLKGKAVKQDA